MTELHDGAKAPQQLTKPIKGTNIIVVGHAEGSSGSALLHAIDRDDSTEILWWHRALRPAPYLQHPSEAFLKGRKTLGPSAVFQTYDVAKSKLRRLVKQEHDKKRALQRRLAEVAPTAAFKAAVHPHKVPRSSDRAPRAEREMFARAERGRPVTSKAARNRKQRAKRKVKKIGKSL